MLSHAARILPAAARSASAKAIRPTTSSAGIAGRRCRRTSGIEKEAALGLGRQSQGSGRLIRPCALECLRHRSCMTHVTIAATGLASRQSYCCRRGVDCTAASRRHYEKQNVDFCWPAAALWLLLSSRSGCGLTLACQEQVMTGKYSASLRVRKNRVGHLSKCSAEFANDPRMTKLFSMSESCPERDFVSSVGLLVTGTDLRPSDVTAALGLEPDIS